MSSLLPYKNVVAVIVTYNGSRWVHQCLSSLAASEYPVSAIIVDNNSTDNTIALIEQSFPNVTVIKERENRGFGQANNIGIQEALSANADFVFLLNQDAWVEKTSIGSLVRAMEENKSYGVVSPLHYTGSGNRLDSGFKNCILKDYTKAQVLEFQSTQTDQIYPSEFINAAAWLVSRACLQQVGGFGTLYFHYGEDRDYINRLNYNGLKLGFISSSKIFHDREDRQINIHFSTKVRLSWYYSVACLVWLSDVNKSFFFSFVSSGYYLFRDMAYHFTKGRLFSVQVLFEALVNTGRSFQKVIDYRKVLKSKNEFLFLRTNK